MNNLPTKEEYTKDINMDLSLMAREWSELSNVIAT